MEKNEMPIVGASAAAPVRPCRCFQRAAGASAAAPSGPCRCFQRSGGASAAAPVQPPVASSNVAAGASAPPRPGPVAASNVAAAHRPPPSRPRPLGPVESSDVDSDDESFHTKTRHVLRRLQAGQYGRPFAQGIYKCPFCNRRLFDTNFNTLLNHAESIGSHGARVGSTVNVHAYMAKHKALGIHLRNLQASHTRHLEALNVPTALSEVLAEKTAAALWLKLESICMSKDLTSKMHVKMKLFSHNRDEQTLAEVYDALQQREKIKSVVQAEGSSSKAEALQPRLDSHVTLLSPSTAVAATVDTPPPLKFQRSASPSRACVIALIGAMLALCKFEAYVGVRMLWCRPLPKPATLERDDVEEDAMLTSAAVASRYFDVLDTMMNWGSWLAAAARAEPLVFAFGGWPRCVCLQALGSGEIFRCLEHGQQVYKAREKATGQIVASPRDDEGVPSMALRSPAADAVRGPARRAPTRPRAGPNKEGQTILYLVFEYMDTDTKTFIRGHREPREIPAHTVKCLNVPRASSRKTPARRSPRRREVAGEKMGTVAAPVEVPTSAAEVDISLPHGGLPRRAHGVGRRRGGHLSIDSADEVDPDLNLVKGRGGSLSSRLGGRFVFIVD
ncbi:hypothetical protein QYE76_052689 [Lolium multiflorum]|uniref:Uncharacterized protein n=1 Tax=Lolium multiflorum TaxID=4521 RepID=A0AAD8SVT7_LOLMU|nr:hypothetical protein QYE76_052689 [Lolium multiflorum]